MSGKVGLVKDFFVRILLVEDVRKLSAYIKKGLEAQSYVVDCAFDGVTAEEMALTGAYDLIILDLMLPRKDGLAVCETLRAQRLAVPILMLTARGEVEDRVRGLDAGADDYLLKPFDFGELNARVRALLRRPKEKLPEVLQVRDISIDNVTRTVEKNGARIQLSLKEYTLLEYLVRNKNIVLTRDQILDNCWGWVFDSYSNIVDVYVKKLRQKLDPGDGNGYIRTIRGVGYIIEE